MFTLLQLFCQTATLQKAMIPIQFHLNGKAPYSLIGGSANKLTPVFQIREY